MRFILPQVCSRGEGKMEIIFFSAQEKEIAGCKPALIDAVIMG